MTLPAARYVVVGAGVHGLSTGWHLASELRRRGYGDDVVVLDKAGVGAGASGIACGVIRNNYFQPAMRRLMAHSVSLWESVPETFAYQPVGYLQVAFEAMRPGLRQIHSEQQSIGYDSTLVEGEGECRSYLRDLFPDWRADGATCVLHEHRGGFAHNQTSLRGLAAEAERAGVRILSGVKVIGLDLHGETVRAVVTDQGRIPCDQLVVAAGPWTRDFWSMLELPDAVAVRETDGTLRTRAMWTYWLVQEGTVAVDPHSFTDSRGQPPPVVHVDSDAPLYDATGALVTSSPWGIYYKPDTNFGGVQGGSMPRRIEEPANEVAVDPYGPGASAYTTDEDFARLWTSGLAHCHQRFESVRQLLSPEPSGGIGCFTPDSFPVFDRFRDNAYVIADSNHGYKMIGVGSLVAKELLGDEQELLTPFRFARYESGQLHPTSSSPFPWS